MFKTKSTLNSGKLHFVLKYIFIVFFLQNFAENKKISQKLKESKDEAKKSSTKPLKSKTEPVLRQSKIDMSKMLKSPPEDKKFSIRKPSSQSIKSIISSSSKTKNQLPLSARATNPRPGKIFKAFVNIQNIYCLYSSTSKPD